MTFLAHKVSEEAASQVLERKTQQGMVNEIWGNVGNDTVLDKASEKLGSQILPKQWSDFG